MTCISDPCIFFSLKNWMWIDRLLAVAGVLRETSWGLSCPFHCGGSWLVSFVAGLAIGILLGLFVAAVLCHYLHPIWTFAHPPSPVFVGSDPSQLRRRARFSAYLHEWIGHHWTHLGHQPSCCCHRISSFLFYFWPGCASWHEACLWRCWEYQDSVSCYCAFSSGHLDSSLQRASFSWCRHWPPRGPGFLPESCSW